MLTKKPLGGVTLNVTSFIPLTIGEGRAFVEKTMDGTLAPADVALMQNFESVHTLAERQERELTYQPALFAGQMRLQTELWKLLDWSKKRRARSSLVEFAIRLENLRSQFDHTYFQGADFDALVACSPPSSQALLAPVQRLVVVTGIAAEGVIMALEAETA